MRSLEQRVARKLYLSIVFKAKKLIDRPSEKDKNFIRHHILPVSLYPLWSNRQTNVVTLTREEHLECHKLLNVIYPMTSMVYAYWLLYNKYNIDLTPEDVNKLNDDFKKKHSKDHSILMKKFYENEENRKITGERSKKAWQDMSEERRQEIREARYKGLMRPESRKKMSFFQKNKKVPPVSLETRAKISRSLTGKKQSIETIQKRSKALKGHKYVPTQESIEKRKKALAIKFQDPEFRKKFATNTGKHWYTNGTVNVVAYECPFGFVPGITSKKKE